MESILFFITYIFNGIVKLYFIFTFNRIHIFAPLLLLHPVFPRPGFGPQSLGLDMVGQNYTEHSVQLVHLTVSLELEPCPRKRLEEGEDLRKEAGRRNHNSTFGLLQYYIIILYLPVLWSNPDIAIKSTVLPL